MVIPLKRDNKEGNNLSSHVPAISPFADSNALTVSYIYRNQGGESHEREPPLADAYGRFATDRLCKQERREREELLRSVELLPRQEGPALPRHSVRVAGRSQ